MIKPKDISPIYTYLHVLDVKSQVTLPSLYGRNKNRDIICAHIIVYDSKMKRERNCMLIQDANVTDRDYCDEEQIFVDLDHIEDITGFVQMLTAHSGGSKEWGRDK